MASSTSKCFRLMGARPQILTWGLLFAIWISLSLVRIALAGSSTGPIVAFDEWITHHHAVALFNGTKYQPSWTQFVYPPRYPLTLSGAMAFGRNFYGVLLAINCLVYSAAIFPAYIISRSIMSRKLPLATAIIVGLVPFPANVRYLMAENLLVPIFLTTVAFVVLGDRVRRHRWLINMLTGMAIAACFLTKFVMFPGVLAFVLLWAVFYWAHTIAHEKVQSPGACLKKFGGEIVTVLGSGILLIGIWLAYASAQSIDMRNALGFTTADLVFGTGIFTPVRIWTWVILYLTYLGVILAPFLPLLVGACAIDCRQRIEGLTGCSLEQKIAALLSDPASRLELIAVGFLGFYLTTAMVHDLSYPGNAFSPVMMSSRYFEFVYPLFIILAMRRLQALSSMPRPISTVPVLAAGVAATLLVVWGAAVFSSRKVFDIGVNVTTTQGVHTTTFLLWSSSFLLIAWIVTPVGASGLTVFLERQKRCKFITSMWIACFVILWPASQQGWRSEGQYRMPYPSAHTDIARTTGELLSGEPSTEHAVVFYDVPGVVNWPIFKRGIMVLYASFFSGTRYTFEFLQNDFYWEITKRRVRNPALFTITRTHHPSCLGPVGRGEPNHVGFMLCPCTLDAADVTALQCRYEPTPLERRRPGTLASYSTVEEALPEPTSKPVFDASWNEAGSFGSAPGVTMHAGSATFALPLSSTSRDGGFVLRLRLASLQPRKIRVSMNGTDLGEAMISDVFPGQWYSFQVPDGLIANGSAATIRLDAVGPVTRLDLIRGIVSLIELSLAKN